MLARFSTKHKLLVLGGVLVTAVAYYTITSYQEIGRLKAMLAHDDPTIKIKAAEELSRAGFGASSASDELAQLIQYYDEDVRRAATIALAKIDKDLAVDALIEALGHNDGGVRLDAAENLERLGSRRGYEAAQLAQQRSAEEHRRTRLKSWAADVRAEFKKERKERYRQHRKIYGY